MDTFRLLHLSDLHIGGTPYVLGPPEWSRLAEFPLGTRRIRPASHDPNLLEGAARKVWELHADPATRLDLVVLTGDLGCSGEVADLDLAYEFVNRPARPGSWLTAGSNPAPTLRQPGLERRVVLIPGNHDRYQGLSCSAGGAWFQTKFSGCWNPQDSVQRLRAVRQVNGDVLVVIGADFTLQSNRDAEQLTRFDYLGQGRVHPVTLRRLQRATEAARQEFTPERCTVAWALHYPPEFADLDRRLRLIDGQDVLAAAGESEVSLVLAGHTHESRRYVVGGVTVLCAGTAAQYYTDLPNAMHLVTLVVDDGRVRDVDVQDLTWDQSVPGFA